MGRSKPIPVVGKDGLRGTIEPATRSQKRAGERVVVHLEDGTLVAIPAQFLVEQADGSITIPIGHGEIESLRAKGDGTGGETLVIPVVEEAIDVRKRTVETGRVRVSKVVTEREETVDVPLLREEVHVERVPVERFVEGPVAVRQEGETTIIPLVEEVLVVEKRLFVREELHVRRRQIEEHKPQRVTVRAEEAKVERVATSGDPAGGPGDRR